MTELKMYPSVGNFSNQNFISLKRLNRTLSLFLSLILAFSPIAPAAPTVKTEFESVRNLTSPSALELPEELGTVKEWVSRPQQDKSPFIIHIQDAHANPEAQEKIRDILRFLKEKTKQSLFVALEGTVGTIHPEYLDLVPAYPDANESLVKDLQEKGELTGAELFAWEEYKESKREIASSASLPPRNDVTLETARSAVIASPEGAKQSRIIFYGVETPDLYRENLSLYRDLLFKREEIENALKPYTAALEVGKSKILNPELRSFLEETKRSKDAFLPQLVQFAKKLLEIDLTDRIEQLRFPNLTRLIVLRELEKDLDMRSAGAEWIKFKQILKKRDVGEENIVALAAAWDDSQKKGKFLRGIFEKLWPVFLEKSIDLASFPSYADWVALTLLSEEIEAEELFREMERLENEIAVKLTKNETEKRFLELLRDFTLLQKLFQAELSHEEHRSALERKEELRPGKIRERLTSLRGRTQVKAADTSFARNDSKLNSFYNQALSFYDIAHKRDQALLDNALDEWKNRDSSPVLVLITGGFHTESLMRQMEERGLSYAVIAPHFTDTDGGKLYHKVMRREHADLSAYFKDSPLTEQESLLFKGLVEKVLPELSAKHIVTPQDLPSWIERVVSTHPVFKKHLQATTFPGQGTPFVRLQTQPVSSQSRTQANALVKIYISTNTHLYPNLASQSSRYEELMNPSTDSQLLGDFYAPRSPQSPFEIVRQPTLALKLENVNVTSGSLSPEDLKRVERARRMIKDLKWHGEFGRSETRASSQEEFEAQPSIRDPRAHNIGFVGAEDAGLTTMAILGQAGHYVTAIDQPAVLDLVTSGTSGEHRLLRDLKSRGRYRSLSVSQEDFNRLVEENEIIYLATGISLDSDYQSYIQRLENWARQLGDALLTLREKEKRKGEKPERRVFVIRAMIGKEISERIYDIIKWHMRPPDYEQNDIDKRRKVFEYLNFDVVYQPDFTYREEEGEVSEPEVMFGLDLERYKEDSGDVVKERHQTITMLSTLYQSFKELDDATQVREVDIRSAEEAKDALLIYLSTKLAHFNDFATVTERWGADLSVAALGAGLDKRILRLFANPSLGFGGRLSLLLDWVYAGRLHRAASKPGATREQIAASETQIRKQIQDRVAEVKSSLDVKKILRELPKDWHMLFWLEVIHKINENTQAHFTQKIKTQYSKARYGSLRGTKVTILGVGYSLKSNQITRSPVLSKIIELKEEGVREFYVTDSEPRLAAFKNWLEGKRKEDRSFEGIIFHGVDPELDTGVVAKYDIYGAVDESALTLVATDSHPEIQKIDLDKLAKALGKKPLFDGINLFGLRADGKTLYPLEDIRRLNINYVSVGRPSMGPRFKSQRTYELGESRIYENVAQLRERLEELRGRPIGELRGPTKVAVMGTGYVGLVTSWILASLGHQVTGVDIDAEKVAGLMRKKIKMPIYEPGLEDVLRNERDAGRFRATIEGDQAIRDSSIIYVAVPTNPTDQGKIDLRHVLSVADQVGTVILQQRQRKIIVIKSTVTADTFEKIDGLMTKKSLVYGRDYVLASNPEFLREGEAVSDVEKPDRSGLGIYRPAGIDKMSTDERKELDRALQEAEAELLELWYRLDENHEHPILVTDTATATFIKYLANSFLALSISFANLMAEDAGSVNADFYEARHSLQADPRIGKKAFLDPGCGYGGSCFPKDSKAIAYLSLDAEHNFLTSWLADGTNEYIKAAIVHKVGAVLAPYAENPIAGTTWAFWGLTFKPRTDDLREAASLRASLELLKENVKQIRIHDPNLNGEDSEHFQNEFVDHLHPLFVEEEIYQNPDASSLSERERPEFYRERFRTYFRETYTETGHVVFVSEPEEAVIANPARGWDSADVIFPVTEWRQYSELINNPEKLESFRDRRKRQAVLDARNIFWNQIQVEKLEELGFGYRGVGVRSFVARSESRTAETTAAPWKARVNALRATFASTERFRYDFAGLRFPTARQAEVVRVEEEGQFAVSEEVAETFYPATFFKSEDPDTWRHLQSSLVQEAGQAREAFSRFLRTEGGHALRAIFQGASLDLPSAPVQDRGSEVHVELEDWTLELMEPFAAVYPVLMSTGLSLKLNILGAHAVERAKDLSALLSQRPEAKLLRQGQLTVVAAPFADKPFASLPNHQIAAGKLHSILGREESLKSSLRRVGRREGLVRWKFDASLQDADRFAADIITVLMATALEKQIADSYIVDYLSPQKAAPAIFEAALTNLAALAEATQRFLAAA